MKTAHLTVEELTCPSCVKAIESALMGQEGVQSVKVLFHSGKIKLTLTDNSNIDFYKRMLEKLGYPVIRININ